MPFGVWDSSWLTNFDSSDKPLTAWWAANLSHAAYCPLERIRVMTKGRGELLQVFENRTQMAYAVLIHDTIFLVFQGSQSNEDTVLDIKFFPKSESGCLVHRGFQKALDIIWDQIVGFLSQLSDEKIIFTGHSLGGALAQLAALRHTPSEIYTFGAPRVGTSTFVNQLTAPHWRFVNCTDLATWAPPAMFGFRHHGEIVFIDRLGVVHFNHTLSDRALQRLAASTQYAAQFQWFRSGNAFSRSLVDHAPVNYCKALSRHLLSKGLEKK